MLQQFCIIAILCQSAKIEVTLVKMDNKFHTNVVWCGMVEL